MTTNATAKPLSGLQRLCKLHGRMKIENIMMVWDYVNDVAIPEKEMHQNRKRWAASETAKFAQARKAGHARF